MTTAPHDLGELDGEEDALLRGVARPIVLVRRRADAGVAPSVAAGSPWLGLMLPYTPLHHLLCHEVGRPLVLTSGNRSDEPIAIDDEDARRRLGEIADAFLSHDRPIHRRCEDSVVRAAFPIRRSRGYAPGPLPLPVPATAPIVAVGAELKSTFCVARDSEAFLSPHLGDLDSEAAYARVPHRSRALPRHARRQPAAVACDLHPEYLSTKWAREQGLPLVEVQHHHAHAAACLAEHGETGEALAVVLDGTGIRDGWNALGRRASSLRPRVVRADRAPRARSAAGRRGRDQGAVADGRRLPRAGRTAGSVRAVARRAREPQGQRAAVLRGRAPVRRRGGAPRRARDGELRGPGGDRAGAPRRRHRRRRPMPARSPTGRSAAPTSSRPRSTTWRRAGHAPRSPRPSTRASRPRSRTACSAAGPPGTVALSGGSFQNLRLLASLRSRLEDAGFRVLSHRLVPPNDGGVSYGQAAVAAATLGAS